MRTSADPSTASRDAVSPPRRIGTTRVGVVLSMGFFLLGAVNLYLVPSTGGIAGLYWDPVLYDLFLHRYVLVFVYVPLIQLPLATSYYLRVRASRNPWGPLRSRRLVFGGFGLVLVARAALLVAGTAYPWDAGSLQRLVDYVLFHRLVGLVGVPELVGASYRFYFAVVVLAVLVAERRSSGGPTGHRSGEQEPSRPPAGSEGEPAAPLESRRHGVRAQWSVPGARSELRLPYGVVVGGVVVLIVAGLVVGGLESAISIAGVLLSLYQLQPREAS